MCTHCECITCVYEENAVCLGTSGSTQRGINYRLTMCKLRVSVSLPPSSQPFSSSFCDFRETATFLMPVPQKKRQNSSRSNVKCSCLASHHVCIFHHHDVSSLSSAKCLFSLSFFADLCSEQIFSSCPVVF